MDEQILVKFKKQSYEQIVKEARKKGLGKSTLVRMITLKAIADIDHINEKINLTGIPI